MTAERALAIPVEQNRSDSDGNSSQPPSNIPQPGLGLRVALFIGFAFTLFLVVLALRNTHAGLWLFTIAALVLELVARCLIFGFGVRVLWSVAGKVATPSGGAQ